MDTPVLTILFTALSATLFADATPQQTISTGLSWTAIGVLASIAFGAVGLMVSIATCLFRSLGKQMGASLEKIQATLQEMRDEIASLKAEWQAGDREHRRFRAELDDHDRRIEEDHSTLAVHEQRINVLEANKPEGGQAKR